MGPFVNDQPLKISNAERLVQKFQLSPRKKVFIRTEPKHELGHVLLFFVPSINSLATHGVRLQISSNIPREFWFFLDDNQITTSPFKFSRKPFCYFLKRSRYVLRFNYNECVQRLKDEGHAPTYWLPPSFKSHYRNNRFNFTKPLLVIQNTFNIDPAKHKAIYGNAKKSRLSIYHFGY